MIGACVYMYMIACVGERHLDNVWPMRCQLRLLRAAASRPFDSKPTTPASLMSVVSSASKTRGVSGNVQQRTSPALEWSLWQSSATHVPSTGRIPSLSRVTLCDWHRKEKKNLFSGKPPKTFNPTRQAFICVIMPLLSANMPLLRAKCRISGQP